MRKGEGGTVAAAVEVTAVDGPDPMEDMAGHTMEADSTAAAGIAADITTPEDIDTMEDIGTTEDMLPTGGMV